MKVSLMVHVNTNFHDSSQSQLETKVARFQNRRSVLVASFLKNELHHTFQNHKFFAYDIQTCYFFISESRQLSRENYFFLKLTRYFWERRFKCKFILSLFRPMLLAPLFCISKYINTGISYVDGNRSKKNNAAQYFHMWW